MDNSTPEQDKKSKSQLKREMTALQKLGEELVNLTASQLKAIDLPESLREAITQARNINAREGRRRQLQFIGRLMRDIDSVPVQNAIDKLKNQHHQNTTQFHKVEQWRDRLLSDDKAALSELISTYPTAEHQQLHQLIRNTKKEADANKPPKSARLLFKYLRKLIDDDY